MQPKELKDRLLKLGQAVNKLTDGSTNYGGCCVFASIVADKLAEMGVPARGVVATVEGFSVDAQRPDNSAEASPEDWADNGLHFNHVGLEVTIGKRRYVFDSEGLTLASQATRLPAGHWPIIPGRLDRDELRSLAASDDWNSWFPRELIPAIETMAAEFLTPDSASEARQAAEDDALLDELLRPIRPPSRPLRYRTPSGTVEAHAA